MKHSIISSIRLRKCILDCFLLVCEANGQSIEYDWPLFVLDLRLLQNVIHFIVCDKYWEVKINKLVLFHLLDFFLLLVLLFNDFDHLLVHYETDFVHNLLFIYKVVHIILKSIVLFGLLVLFLFDLVLDDGRVMLEREFQRFVKIVNLIWIYQGGSFWIKLEQVMIFKMNSPRFFVSQWKTIFMGWMSRFAS